MPPRIGADDGDSRSDSDSQRANSRAWRHDDLRQRWKSADWTSSAGERFRGLSRSVGEAEILVNLPRRRRLVERDEVQARNTLGQQLLAHRGGNLHANSPYRLGIVGNRKQTLGKVGWKIVARQDREPLDLAYRGERHDARNDRDVAASRRYAITQHQIVVDREEHLGDGEVGAGRTLAHEVGDVGFDRR